MRDPLVVPGQQPRAEAVVGVQVVRPVEAGRPGSAHGGVCRLRSCSWGLVASRLRGCGLGAAVARGSLDVGDELHELLLA